MDKSKSNVLSLLRKTSKGQMRYDIYDANDMTVSDSWFCLNLRSDYLTGGRSYSVVVI